MYGVKVIRYILAVWGVSTGRLCYKGGCYLYPQTITLSGWLEITNNLKHKSETIVLFLVTHMGKTGFGT